MPRNFVELLERVRELLRNLEPHHGDAVRDLRLEVDRAIEAVKRQ
jgi:hypothetical protein